MCVFSGINPCSASPPLFSFLFLVVVACRYRHFFVLIFVLFIQFFFLFLSRCNYEKECEISAVSADFGGDPCPRTPKYLEVYYGCYPGKNQGSAARDSPTRLGKTVQFVVLKGVCHEIFGSFFSLTNKLKCVRIMFLFLFHGSI